MPQDAIQLMCNAAKPVDSEFTALSLIASEYLAGIAGSQAKARYRCGFQPITPFLRGPQPLTTGPLNVLPQRRCW
jgi:hypothetical protein